jgi:elongation factor 3
MAQSAFMMAPAAIAASPATKASGAFDIPTLFVADKASRDASALDLANAAKTGGVEFFAQIGLSDALVVVSVSILPFT